MRNCLSQLKPSARKLILAVARAAESRGYRAYLVGGFVRDVILKKRNLDIDIVVEGDAAALAKELVRTQKAAATLHGQFGTAVLIFPNGFRLDLASARKEVYIYPGALPQVSPGNLREDLFRRDFTVNTLAVTINPRDFGRLVDFFRGQEDIKKKRIRVLHAKSFEDDPTRILRAVRFEQRFGFRIERTTLTLLKKALEKKMVDYVKPPRYFEEFKKMLEEPCPRACLRRLASLKAGRFLSENFRFDIGKSRTFGRLEQNTRWFRKTFPGRDLEQWISYFAVLLQGMALDRQKKICRRFQLSKYDTERIVSCAQAPRVVKELSAKGSTSSGIYRTLRGFSAETIVFFRARTSLPLVLRRIDRFLKKDNRVKLSINGFDVQKAGVSPGPRVGIILEQVLYAKIDGRVKSREDELALVKEMIR